MTAATRPNSPSLAPVGWIVIGLAGMLTAALCVVLFPKWRSDPDLSHGLFAPMLFVLLLRESRRRGPWRFPVESLWLKLLRGGALVGGIALIVLAGAFAASVEWSHPMVGMSLAVALSGMLLGTLLWLSLDTARAVPLNWTSLVAVCFWPLCAPLPPGTYSRVTLQLQFWVTEIVLNCLHLLGIPASTTGNIIILSHTSVGVEEACSGVRSLLSCFVAALFFSATLVQRPWARVLLIALALPLAFAMNIIRSLVLTLLANNGVDIAGQWHDVTGFAVLGLTALILGGVAVWLEDCNPIAPSLPKDDSVAAKPFESHKPPRPWGVVASYSCAIALIGFFIFNTHGPTEEPGAPPILQALLPAAPAGWDRVHTETLYQFSSILETEHLIQRTYIRRGDEPGREPVQITIYLAYWPSGQAPVSLVASHTPDACWPGSGWSMQPVEQTEMPFLSGDRLLPTPEYRAFTNRDRLQHVWYWHLYDGASITQDDPRSALALLKLAWNYGFRTEGEQMFVRISSNRPWDEIRNEPLLTGIFPNLKDFGL